MDEICNKKGFVLVTAIFIMLLMLTLGIYATSFVITEMKISDSQANSVKTYYLAEAGVAEAIWRLKNDPTWKSGFEDTADWTMDYTRTPALYSNGSYNIQITNSEKAKGDIIVTASLNLGANSTQRVVKTSVYKATGESVIGRNGEYADGNIDMSGSILQVFNGGFFSNGNIIINYSSIISATGDVGATGNIIKNHNSTITASSTHASNDNPPAPLPIPMPAVSFDNASDPLSYKSRANQIYTADQFSDLLYENKGQTLTLDGITYVTGAVDIYGSNDLIINGALVADGNIVIGKDTNHCCWGSNCYNSASVTINSMASGTPSGLLSKGRVDFESCADTFNGTGLIYANDKINILSLTKSVNVIGALVARKLTLTSLWEGVRITFDTTIVNSGLGSATFSPVVTVDHWEEEY